MGELLHLHNGDAARVVLERSGVPGEHGVWAEVLHEGAVHGLLPRAEWRPERGRFYREHLGAPASEEDRGKLEEWDAWLERAPDFDEVILWFEHDLYDQLCLIHHLHHFSGVSLASTRLWLVCIGAFPGVERFIGLGQLDPEQMASLVEAREAVSPDQLALGARAWRAFCAEQPLALAALLGEDSSILPFLAPALRRFFEEYPAPDDGLSRTERQCLRLLAEGLRSGADLFQANTAAEESPFMGDTILCYVLEGLAREPHPLLEIVDDAPAWRDRRLVITAAGVDVLSGASDAVALRGSDRWRGGVHLQGRGHVWRWDAEAGRFVRR